MTAVRLPRPAALATVLALLGVAIAVFPRQAYGQLGGRVLTRDGVPPAGGTILVTVKGIGTPEHSRPVVGGRFTFPALAAGTRVRVQAIAQGLISNEVTATAPDTMVVLILRPARADEKFNLVQQGAPVRARAAETPAAAPAPGAGATAAATAGATAAATTPTPAAATPTPAAAPAPAASDNVAASANGMSVQDALFTAVDLVDRAPVSVGGCTASACSTRYPATVGTVTFWTRLSGGAPGRWVEHVWFWDGEEVARVRQKVEASTWRTWTRKKIDPDWTGDWKVEVRAEDGTVLAERFFTIEKQ